MLSTTSSVGCSRSARSTCCIAFSKSSKWPRSNLGTSWRAERVEHRRDVAVRLDGDERGAAHLVRAHHPARELGRERGLAFAALAAHHRLVLVPQQPLQREQVPAAPDEAGLRPLRQLAETRTSAALKSSCVCRAGES